MVKHRHSLALFSLVVYSILFINTDNTSLVSSVDGFSNRAAFCSSTSSRRYQTSYTSLPSTTKSVKANHDRWYLTRPVPLYMSVEDDNNSEDTDTTTTTTEEQLQKRFEEAMKRRKQRGVLKDQEVETKSTVINNEDEETNMGDLGTSVLQDSSTLKSSTIEDEDETVQRTSKRRPRQPRYDDETFIKDNKRRSSASLKSTVISPRRYPTDRYEGKEYSYVSDSDDNRYDDEYDDERRYRSSRPPSTPKCEWETYRSTSIVFPPQLLLDESNNKDIPSRPNAIVHFVGGTFFGSYPRKFYGSLLEDIATKCNAVVVATPIPLVLPGKGLVNKVEKWMFDEGGIYDGDDYGRRKRGDTTATNNPLDHLSLAESIQQGFNNVYRDVVLDEYCAYMNATEVEDFMKDVPIVGIGHSLGARIQAISCSHPSISQRCLSMGKGNRLIRSGRDGMVYLGFANWGASSSIPGVETLDRTVKKRKRGQQREGRGAGRRDDIWDERRRPQSSSRSRRRRRSKEDNDDRRRRYSRYDRYEAEDLDLVDVFGDVVQDVVKGAKQIGEALTPETEDLEFTPTPNELWDDISDPDGCYRQSSRSNLIVQFDDDPIDQGSRLARTLLTAYDEVEESNSTKVKDGHDSLPHDVKFARLSGGHLTPVTVREGIAKVLPRGAVSLLSSSYNFILKQLNDERMGKSSQRQKREVKDVANTIASYIGTLNSDQ